MVKEIYYKSDFKIILASEGGWNIPFKLRFYTADENRSFFAYHDGHRYVNCSLLEDGRLAIAVNNHNLGYGELHLAPEFFLTDTDYADDICNQHIAPYVPTFIDEDGTEYTIVLSNTGSSTIETIGSIPAFYLQGERGEQGIQGVPGERGERGLPGERGEKGERGERGEQGVQGVQGIQGLPGERGLRGVQGERGEKGDKGDPGLTQAEHDNLIASASAAERNASIAGTAATQAFQATTQAREAADHATTAAAGVSSVVTNANQAIVRATTATTNANNAADRANQAADNIQEELGDLRTEVSECVKNGENEREIDIYPADGNGAYLNNADGSAYVGANELGAFLTSHLDGEENEVIVTGSGLFYNGNKVATTDQIPTDYIKNKSKYPDVDVEVSATSNFKISADGLDLYASGELNIDGDGSTINVHNRQIGLHCGSDIKMGWSGEGKETTKHIRITSDEATLNDKPIATTDITDELDAKVGDLAREITDNLKVSEVKTNGNIVLTDGNGNAREYMAATPSGDPMHYAYVAAGAVWNAGTGYWELNGLTDITNEQMLYIYSAGLAPTYPTARYHYSNNNKIRTILPHHRERYNYGPSIDMSCIFAYCSELEVIRLCKEDSFNNRYNMPSSSSFQSAFIGTRKLKDASYYKVDSCTTAQNIVTGTALERIFFDGLKVNLTISSSPLLRAECIAYWINKSTATSAIVITLHATAYARAMDDSAVQAALAAHTNVSLASA